MDQEPPPAAADQPVAAAKPATFQEWIQHVNYDWQRDSPTDLRNALLVVAVLFVTVAFQAGINLPAHIFPQDKDDNHKHNRRVVVGQALFLVCNTLLISTSTFLIHYLTATLPFSWEIMAAAWSLMATYGCSVGATDLPECLKFPILFIPFLVWSSRWVPHYRRILRNRFAIVPTAHLPIQHQDHQSSQQA